MGLNVLALVTSVLCSSIAHVALKVGIDKVGQKGGGWTLWSNVFDAWLVFGVLGHIAALFIWAYCLSKVDISFAYPFLSLGYVLIALIAHFFLNEIITYTRITGMILIVAGIVFISKS